MLTTFWNGVAEALASQWVQRVLGPAFAFWAGGFLCLVWRDGWQHYVERWSALDTGQHLLIIGAGLMGVVGSTGVVRRFDTAMLRLLEGYWPPWPGIGRLRRFLTGRFNASWERDKSTFIALQEQGLDRLSAEELERLAATDRQLRKAPLQPEQRMPTRLGNVLRAAERRPRDRYGLETVAVWPRLWLILPEQARLDVGKARMGLQDAVRLVTWSLLFVLWGVVAWWAFIPGLLIAYFGYRTAVARAETYGELLESCFDLYRFDLYHALHWPRPSSTAEERAAGERLSAYLYRGFQEPAV
ncbi:MAG TPA: hypothetical protein EYH32_05320, partial [Anaerolineae bacterium]|nr:hypothetical protein [Anaerolineae bacterium]